MEKQAERGVDGDELKTVNGWELRRGSVIERVLYHNPEDMTCLGMPKGCWGPVLVLRKRRVRKATACVGSSYKTSDAHVFEVRWLGSPHNPVSTVTLAATKRYKVRTRQHSFPDSPNR